jgi:hypothetical protein
MRPNRFQVPVLAGVAIALAACTTQEVGREASPPPPAVGIEVAPALTVEQFLSAVNADEWASMGRLFGTSEGPFGDRNSREDVELRMNAIALILKHEDFTIRSQRRVPGRERTTVRLGVDLTVRGELIEDVAFLVVLADSGSWLIEEIDLVKVTSS